MKRLLAAAAAMAIAGCSTSSQTAPPLSGPSELALSLAVTASPDMLTQDGQSASMVTVVARDPNGQPVRGMTLRLAMYQGGNNVDYGTLASKIISTDNSGVASTIYTSPMPPPITDTDSKTVDIQVRPTGTNYDSSEPRYVSIHLIRPGVILPPNPPLVANFIFSPSQVHENESVQFDASGSTGAIVSYQWNFGDGTTGTGVRVTHSYPVAAVYNVTLTLTDTHGVQQTSAAQGITVLVAEDPKAKFQSSPQSPSVNDDVHFDASESSVPAGRTIVAYDWNFGDGSIGSGKTPTHKYGQANTYTVILTVTDNTGRTGSIPGDVQVKAPSGGSK